MGATIVDGTVVSSAGAELGLVEMPGVRYRNPSGISPRAGDGGRAEGEWELVASRSRTRTEMRPRNDGGTICWYLVTYRISTGEIVSEELLFCSGGGGGVCTREQESIADEYDNAQLYRGGRSWSCEDFADTDFTSGHGTEDHTVGFITAEYRSNKSATKPTYTSTGGDR